MRKVTNAPSRARAAKTPAAAPKDPRREFLDVISKPLFTKKQLGVFFIAVTAFVFVGAGAAVAIDYGTPTTPTGFGDLIPMPDLSGGGQKTLFESYDMLTWQLDSDLGDWDIAQKVMWGLTNLLMMLWLTVVYAAVGLTWWLFSLTSVDPVSDAVSGMIGTASTEMLTWLFPSALAFGAVVLIIQNRRDGGGGLGQLAWMGVAGVFAISLAVTPATWTDGIDGVRNLGADTIINATGDAISEDSDEPFVWPAVEYNGTAKDNTLRKSGDAIWRALVATPWCIANYGSTEACQRYGVDMLDLGQGINARTDYIRDTIYPEEADGNRDAGKATATGQWVSGQNWSARLGIVVLGLLVALLGSLLLIVIGFGALAAIITSLFLLIVGVFFAMLWVVPGKLRQWGVMWFEALVGAVVSTFISLLVFAAVLILLSATFAATATFGWFPAIGIALVICIVAFSLRGQLERIVSSSTPGFGRSAVVGMMLMRSVKQGGQQALASRATRRQDAATKGINPSGRPQAGKPGDGDRLARPGTNRNQRRGATAETEKGKTPEFRPNNGTAAKIASDSPRSTTPSAGSKPRGRRAAQASTGRAVPATARPQRSYQAAQRPSRVDLPDGPRAAAAARPSAKPAARSARPRTYRAAKKRPSNG